MLLDLHSHGEMLNIIRKPCPKYSLVILTRTLAVMVISVACSAKGLSTPVAGGAGYARAWDAMARRDMLAAAWDKPPSGGFTIEYWASLGARSES